MGSISDEGFFMVNRVSCFVLIFTVIGAVAVAATNEQAQRHFDRGTAAVEMAVSKSDFEAAAREFAEAARLAPAWPEVHYNLGLVREKIDDLDGAVISLKRYLELVPGTADAAAVRSQINKLEFRKERLEEQSRVPTLLEGTWRGFNTFCGGTRPDLRIIVRDGGSLFAEMLVGWNADTGSATHLQTFPVAREGDEIKFSFICKFAAPAIDLYREDPVHYQLRFVRPGLLEGSIAQGGASVVRDVSLKKL